MVTSRAMDPSKPSLFRPGVGQKGMTELHFAAYCGDMIELVRCLNEGLPVNAVDSYRGYTPLHWLADMAATGGPRIEMLRELVRHGANLDIKSSDGKTALVLAREAGSLGGDKLAAELAALGAAE